MLYSLFLIIGIPLLGILIFSSYMHHGGQDTTHRKHRIILWVNFAAAVFDLFRVMIFEWEDFFPVWIIYLVSMVYFANKILRTASVHTYSNTGCYNQTVFDQEIQKKIDESVPFNILAFDTEDVTLMKKYVTWEDREAMVKRLIDYCHDLFGIESTFFLDVRCFALLVKEREVSFAVSKIDEFSEKMLDSESFKFSPHYCLITHPGYAKNVGDVNEAISTMLYEVFPATGEHLINVNSGHLADKQRYDRNVSLLKNALANDGFEMHYQPILNLKTGKFEAAEALIRLKGKNMPGPDEFIKVAEQRGMISELGEKAFDIVCRFISENRESLAGIKHIAVNLSMGQILDRSTPVRFTKILDKYNVPVEMIRLEITESLGGNDKKIINTNIQKLSDLGFSFSIDDYGTGYSSATYLSEFPFETLKIDKSILWKAMKDQVALSVLKYTINLIHELGHKVICEGIETPEMASLLKRLRCDFLQGFLYSRPLRQEDYLQFIKENN